MADKEYESKIKLTADTAGAKETAREIDKVGESAKKAAQQTDGVGKAAKETASTAKSAFAGIGTAIGSATKAFHAFTRALGFIGLAIRARSIRAPREGIRTTARPEDRQEATGGQ